MSRDISIGSDASRDYADIATFISAAAAGIGGFTSPVNESTPWNILLYNDQVGAGDYTLGTTVWPASNATYPLSIAPATGNGANGEPNDHRESRASDRTEPLVYNNALGIAFLHTASYQQAFTVSGGTRIEGIQLKVTGLNGYGIVVNGTDCPGTMIEGCILEGTHGQQNPMIKLYHGSATPVEILNNVVICKGVRETVLMDNGGSGVINVKGNTFVSYRSSTDTKHQCKFSTANANAVFNLYGNVSVGHRVGGDFAKSGPGTHNTADNASTDTTGEVTSVVLADIFEGVLALTLPTDCRPVAGEALAGAYDSTVTPLDLSGLTRAAISDIGAWELVASGSLTTETNGVVAAEEVNSVVNPAAVNGVLGA